MSDSVRPHRRQPTRLSRPWDSPSKNTGVGCHFLLQCMKVKSESEVTQLCLTLATPWTTAYQAPLSMGFLGKSTGVGCHCLLRINLLDTVKLSFRKLHHFMLSQQHMSTDIPTSHPQFRGNIWYYSMLSLNFCQFSW